MTWKPDEDETEYLVVPKKKDKDEERLPKNLTRAEELALLDRIFGGHGLDGPEPEKEDD